MTGDPKQRLGGYATDSLTDAERQDLLRAALEDQALFDTLVEEEGLRELLADPEARQQVLAELERPDGWEGFRAWLRRPATVADLLTVAVALVVAVVAQQVYQATRPAREIPAATRPAALPLSQSDLDRRRAAREWPRHFGRVRARGLHGRHAAAGGARRTPRGPLPA